jgi:DNA-nicking Smr family endonuclease
MSPSPVSEADARLWSAVAATVRPLRNRFAPDSPAARRPALPPNAASAPNLASAESLATPARRDAAASGHFLPIPDAIEPGRRRRLERGRDHPAACLDLHGLNQDAAKAALTSFILRGWNNGLRAVLVVTGKGALGDGVLRRRVPEWLAETPLRQVVAGLSEAHRRHGGAGALYVALKRAKPR